MLDLLGHPAAADVALLIGVLAMLAAALAGFADYSTTDGRARVRATVHSTLMLVALVLYLFSLGIRATGPASRGLPIALSIVAYVVLAAGAFVGGDVAYLLGNMVDRHAWRPSGTKWQPLEVGDVPEGTLVKARVGSQDLVLVRTGDTILALARPVRPCWRTAQRRARSPAAASSARGTARGSRSRAAGDDAARRSTTSPTYEVRPVEAGGYEARRTS